MTMPGSMWKIKEMLTSDLVFMHYDPKKEIIIVSDASSYRRAWIMHKLENCLIKPIVQVFRTLL